MRFSFEQRFAAPPDAVLAALTDPDLYPTYSGLTKVAPPSVISRRDADGTVHLRLQMRFIAPLNAAVTAVVDPDKLSWVQDEVYDLARARASVRFDPDNYADRISCSGAYTFAPDPTDARRTVRRIEGEFKVKVFLVGGQVEKAMVSGLHEHYDEEQPIIERWLDAHR